MSLKRIRLLIWKEFIQLRRDPLLIRLLLIMPVLQLILFGYVVAVDVRNLSTAVVDLDRTAISRRAIMSKSFFSGSGRRLKSAFEPVGMMAWWSDTSLLATMASTRGKKFVQPSKGGSFAARWITQEAFSAISEVRYRLSVRG